LVGLLHAPGVGVVALDDAGVGVPLREGRRVVERLELRGVAVEEGLRLDARLEDVGRGGSRGVAGLRRRRGRLDALDLDGDGGAAPGREGYGGQDAGREES